MSEDYSIESFVDKKDIHAHEHVSFKELKCYLLFNHRLNTISMILVFLVNVVLGPRKHCKGNCKYKSFFMMI